MAEQYLTASAVADALPDEPLGSAVLPGRNWHQLADAFQHWGMPTLAAWWSRSATGDSDPWPFTMLASRDEFDRMRAELAAFDVDRIDDEYHHLPDGDDDVFEAADLVGERLPAWIDGALAQNRALYVVCDGAK